MQNLTKEDIQQHAVVNEQSVEIRVALPLTPLKTQQWAEQFCEIFHFSLSDADWGADRFQALVTVGKKSSKKRLKSSQEDRAQYTHQPLDLSHTYLLETLESS